MKRIILSIALSVVFIMASCKSKAVANTVSDKVEINKILGVWVNNNPKLLRNNIGNPIVEIHFKKDSKANITVLDTIGMRTISGTWSLEKTENYKKVIAPNIEKIMGKGLKPDVILQYRRDGKGMRIIAFSKENTENGIRLESGTIQLEKK